MEAPNGHVICPNLPSSLTKGLGLKPSYPAHWSSGFLFLVCVCVLICSVVSGSSVSVTLWTVACQDPLPMGFPRQEYWCGLPFSPSGDFPNPGTEPQSPALTGGFFILVPLGKPHLFFFFLSTISDLVLLIF